jgi:hypothetical protein
MEARNPVEPLYLAKTILYIKVTEMGAKLGADCPCGFSFVTPHGKDDGVAVLQDHVGRIHKKDYPNGLSREEALSELSEK